MRINCRLYTFRSVTWLNFGLEMASDCIQVKNFPGGACPRTPLEAGSTTAFTAANGYPPCGYTLEWPLIYFMWTSLDWVPRKTS